MNDPRVQFKVKCLDPFKKLYQLPPDINTVICIGGRGGAKTHEVSKFTCFSACALKKRFVVLRDEKELVRESILNEILLRYDTANKDGILDLNYERLSIGIKDRQTDEMLVFTKGFRASSTQKSANLKSISNIDGAVIEETEDIRDKSKFDKFNDSIRKEGSVVIMILNTPDILHWIIQRYFDITHIEVPAGQEAYAKEYEGYYKITPKNIPGFLCIQTSFEDNPYLPQHIVDRYRSYGDRRSHMFDLHYYLTDILGYASTGRKGQVLRKVKRISLAEYLALPFREFYGQDFGTASPAGMVGVKFDGNNCYCRELNYLPMSTLEIGKKYCSLGLGNADRVVADNADKDAITKLKNGFKSPNDIDEATLQKYPKLKYGFDVHKCHKEDGNVFGYSLMKDMNLFAVNESLNLWTEIINHVYDQDKYGNYIDEPIDDYNHLIDPWRYVIVDQRGKNKYKVETQGNQRPQGFQMPDGYT